MPAAVLQQHGQLLLPAGVLEVYALRYAFAGIHGWVLHYILACFMQHGF